jgi:hypothetical protein
MKAPKPNDFFSILKGWIWVWIRIQTSCYYLFLKYIFFSVSVEGPEAASSLDGQLSYFSGTEKKKIHVLHTDKCCFPVYFFRTNVSDRTKS